MSAEDRQALIFLAGLAACFVLYAAVGWLPPELWGLALPQLLRPQFFKILVLGLLLLGVPHGSLDTVYAQQTWQLKQAGAWALFVACYLATTGVVLLGLQLAPSPGLALFLALSVWHFAGDLRRAQSSSLTRLVYGGTLVVLPFWNHSAEVTQVFARWVGPRDAASFQAVLQPLSGLWLGGVACGVLECLVKKRWLNGSILAANATLALCLPPLLAFSVYFCGMHSPRHLVRTVQGAPTLTRQQWLWCGVLPTLVVIALGVAVEGRLQEVGGASDGAPLWRVVFTALAALTVPHMMLLHRSGSLRG